MFEQSLVLEPPVNRWSVATSLALQFSLVATALVVPLVWFEALPAMPVLPPAVIAPKIKAIEVFTPERIVRTASAMTAALLPQRRIFEAPPRIPSRVNTIIDAAPAEFVIGTSQGPSVPTIGVPDSIGQISAPPPPTPAPKNEPTKTTAATPTQVRVSSGLQAAKLIAQIKPIYPALAKQARVQGVVRLQATIARDGSIQQLSVLMGHPLLVSAAVDAVKQWRYSPTVLNGSPVEVLTQIDVNFTLSQ